MKETPEDETSASGQDPLWIESGAALRTVSRDEDLVRSLVNGWRDVDIAPPLPAIAVVLADTESHGELGGC